MQQYAEQVLFSYATVYLSLLCANLATTSDLGKEACLSLNEYNSLFLCADWTFALTLLDKRARAF